MIASAVTGRYVEALFRLAQRKGQLAAVDADVKRIAAELQKPRARLVFDARLDVHERRAMLAELIDALSPLGRNFVNLLFDKRREAVLREVPAVWRRRSLEERGAVEGVVESARPLERGEIDRLAKSLGARLSKDVVLENRIVPELVGGVRVVVGGQMMDGSVQGRLAGLRRRMLESPLTVARG